MSLKPLYKVRDIENLKDMIQQSAELFGDKDAFLVKNDEGVYKGITYAKFKNDIDALGTAFLDLGLKDSFIAVIGENRYEWCVTYLSTVNGTGVAVPLDKELPVSEIHNLLSRSEASAVVYSGKFHNIMREISSKLPNVKYFINMDGKQDEQSFMSYHSLAERGKELLAQCRRDFVDAEIDNKKMSILLFTSGTTDLAKGVMLNHKNICSNITSVCSTVRIESSDVSLSILPIHHTYECSLGFLALMYNGATMAFNEGLKQITKNLKEVRPTLLIAVPLILENMYRKIWEQAGKMKFGKAKLKTALFAGDFISNLTRKDIRRKLLKQIHQVFGGRLRLIITGAAAINPEVSRGFRKMGILVLQGYGLTECSPLVTGNRDNAFVDSSAGLPIPGVSVELRNCNENGIGEIAVKGDNVMLGYYKNEEATRSCMKDGWFYTGDLGKMDKKGFLYITGRSKNVIVTKNGKNIYPEEVEAYINKNPFVQESLVWGKYDETSGETHVNAQIFPNLDAIKERLKLMNVSREELMKIFNEVIKNVNKDMPLYKRVREFTIRESEFVKTTTRKIKRYMEKGDQGSRAGSK